ncbi:unnamed protein product [Echinostoma caproni]|uniref:Alpha-1,4 glucan phosphorylase n=1 Tax=Echinostoma caproni TaxID=27848 RepID=A0A3P8GT76_9TREM|nr:unnamed protein product [Echinostoma caproni]
MNGALTIGTMDGANVEMCEEMGRENMFVFGLTVDQITELHKTGLAYDDRFLLCADYADYIRVQGEVEAVYKDEQKWAKMMLMNIASSGKFSSDRTIREYARDIWGVEPSNLKLPPPFEPVDKK